MKLEEQVETMNASSYCHVKEIRQFLLVYGRRKVVEREAHTDSQVSFLQLVVEILVPRKSSKSEGDNEYGFPLSSVSEMLFWLSGGDVS